MAKSSGDGTASGTPTQLTADLVRSGPAIPPIERLRLFQPQEWEKCVEEWANSLRSKYPFVERVGGAGDQGRDVCGYDRDPPIGCAWDNYQCKHYDHPLQPEDIWLELGKLCVYTFRNEFTVPRNYFFVAPQGVGPSVARLLKQPQSLRRDLLLKWSEKVAAEIAGADLVGPLKAYVESFDFSIVGYLPPLRLIEGHRKTPYFVSRFGGGLPPRPIPPTPPKAVAANETRYVTQLLRAYGDCENCSYASPDGLPVNLPYKRHLDRSREAFYRAESLQAFSRDTVPPGTFEALQEHIYNVIIDIAESDHENGFLRVKATVQAAQLLPVDSHALHSVLAPEDKGGVCHQLANSDRLTWVPEKT